LPSAISLQYRIVGIELNARPAGTIQRLGEDTSGGSLARAAWPHEQIGVSQTVLRDGIAERAHHVILAEHIGEGLRAVFTGENLVAHGRSDSERGEGRKSGRTSCSSALPKKVLSASAQCRVHPLDNDLSTENFALEHSSSRTFPAWQPYLCLIQNRTPMKRLLLPCSQLLLQAADWPHWRGSARTGISTETVPESFAGNGPKELWKAQVGLGFSSFAVAGGKVYTLGHADDQDTVFCLDAKTGKEVWKHTYDAELGDKYYEGGPSSTPTVDGAQVLALSKWGDVFCFDAATGKIAWQKNIAEEISAGIPDWGFAGSPAGALATRPILSVGAAGVALNKADGKIVWKSEGDAPAGYSTPLPIKASGQDLVILATKEALHGPRSRHRQDRLGHPLGNALLRRCRRPHSTADGKLFISTGYWQGLAGSSTSAAPSLSRCIRTATCAIGWAPAC